MFLQPLLQRFVRFSLPLLCLISEPTFGWNLSPKQILEAKRNGVPKWMEQGMCADFAYFENGFSGCDITNFLNEIGQMKDVNLSGIVRVIFQSGAVSCNPLTPLSEKQAGQLDSFISALMELDEILPLPYLDFVLSLNPGWDRPLLSQSISVPIFSISKEAHHSKIILVPNLWDPERQEKLNCILSPVWEEKRLQAVWRGRASDGPYGLYDWDFRPRTRLCLLSKQQSDVLDAKFSNQSGCSRIRQMELTDHSLTHSEQANYKYLLSLDGISASSSLEWQLFSKSLVLKSQSNQIQWFHRGLIPFEHFIPFHPDCSDLLEKILWAQLHDDEARVIASNAHEFAIKTLDDDSVFLYLYRILNLYSQKYTRG